MKILKKASDMKLSTQKLALALRKQVLNMVYRAKASHIGSCYSIIDILSVLYGGVMQYSSENPSLPGRDRFILSKGHGALGLYSVLVEKGFISENNFETFMQNGTTLIAHPIMNPEFGSDIKKSLFDNITSNLTETLTEKIAESVSIFIPQIILTDVQVNNSDVDNNQIGITIQYRLKISNEPDQITVQFI